MGLISGIRSKMFRQKGARIAHEQAKMRARASGAKLQLEDLKANTKVYQAEEAVRQEKKTIRSLRVKKYTEAAAAIGAGLKRMKGNLAPVSAAKGGKKYQGTPVKHAHFETKNTLGTGGKTALDEDYSTPEWLGGKKR